MIVEFYGKMYKNDAKIPLETFDIWEKRAVKAINNYTARDISKELDDNIKMCICEVAEFLFEASKRSGIESENNDGYSVKFQNLHNGSNINSIVKMWLSGSDLLYRGDVL